MRGDAWRTAGRVDIAGPLVGDPGMRVAKAAPASSHQTGDDRQGSADSLSPRVGIRRSIPTRSKRANCRNSEKELLIGYPLWGGGRNYNFPLEPGPPCRVVECAGLGNSYATWTILPCLYGRPGQGAVQFQVFPD